MCTRVRTRTRVCLTPEAIIVPLSGFYKVGSTHPRRWLRQATGVQLYSELLYSTSVSCLSFPCVSFPTHTEHFPSDISRHQTEGFFPHTKQFSAAQAGCPKLNLILTLSTWGQYQTPQAKGSVPHDCPPPLQMLTASIQSPGCLQLLSDLATNQRFPSPLPQIQLIC